MTKMIPLLLDDLVQLQTVLAQMEPAAFHKYQP